MASMFASAKKLPSSKAKKSDKVQIEMDGLLDSAALDALIKQLTAVKATIDADVKSQMSVEFVRIGAAKKSRPENFEGTNGFATASCELRARATSSPLSEGDAKMPEEAGLPVEKVTTVQECYVINPAYFADQAILQRVEKALSKITGLPEDFIMVQGEVSKSIVGKDAIEMLFSTGDTKKIAELLPHVSVLAIKPKLDAKANAFEIVRDMLGLGVKEDEKEDA